MPNPVEKALELLRDGEGWCQGTFMTKSLWTDNTKYCSVGAAIASRYDGNLPAHLTDGDWDVPRYLNKAVQELGLGRLVMDFNDRENTKFEDVKHVFEVAAKLWERDHE